MIRPTPGQLVAHRGYPDRYPENTLVGLRAALVAGAQWVEFDVHLSKDRVPVLLHDWRLERTTDGTGVVAEHHSTQLQALHAGYSRCFGTRFQHEPLPTLAAAASLLQEFPAAHAFVEIKRSTVRHFGAEACVHAMTATLAPVRDRCVLISFDSGVVRQARALADWPIGWVFERWNPRSRNLAHRLAPEWLFSSIHQVPDGLAPLWSGPWQWALYHTSDPAQALHWLDRGASMVETNAIGAMLQP